MNTFPSPPEKPTPPPCRTYKETFWGGLVETEESKAATKAWIKEYEERNNNE